MEGPEFPAQMGADCKAQRRRAKATLGGEFQRMDDGSQVGGFDDDTSIRTAKNALEIELTIETDQPLPPQQSDHTITQPPDTGYSFHIPLFPAFPGEFKMKFLICLVLVFISSTPGKASCPERYELVSYRLGSERKESCYFVSTDYIRWQDGADFCARNHNGYLAEFFSLAEWEAFKIFISNIANQTKDKLWDGQHVWIGASIFDRSVWKWNTSGEVLDPLLSNGFPKDDLYGVTINVHSRKMVPQKLASPVCPGNSTIHSYVCESDERVEREAENQDSETFARSNSECQAELQRSRQEVQQLQEEAVALASSLEELLREREQMISSLQRELEAVRKTTELPSATEAATSLVEETAKPKEQATDFLIPNMIFTIKKSDENVEAKSEVVEAGGLRWWVSVLKSTYYAYTSFLVHAERGVGAPSPWTLTVQSLTLKVLRKGGEGGAPFTCTLRLEEASFSSEKGVVGMLSLWGWVYLIHPLNGFIDSQGTLHVEFSFEGPSMSPSRLPQRPTVWQAEATVQLRNFTSSLREDWGLISSPSVHVGGVEWRVTVGRLNGSYGFFLQCYSEKRSDWSLKVDYTVTVLSAEGGGRNEEEKGDGQELIRAVPWKGVLDIPEVSIATFLVADTLSVAVKIRVRH
ncbi:unnamed protein product [Cyprideis torosa]|uniref:Uncharacterized protein n=1 Tax=Cyprideis torosa TaxID=163714 RepID=A0A7R8W5F3_9CRUS|nr:unnamed protein product [Cyprideis torosa]CAG0885215.1 unnamed protein product [Cyprideis torosa]